ncbi:CPBP family intramembrane glutamic endopeptidase [Nocardioides sp. Kera G14]|uniref:CPBP family intramembrane glutamic endopeptidase n=1 Tax=Nocardioides sp. Kera G14 TaxID=2884264 RepID=UPI001D121B04|nr:type II CAAX endopeptidase family protein [Nocardioides sp. Kera G14]UDY22698.1 CPBP family intramembrane metalloprotease [Nocardioides sp. Kera G14]
MTPGLEYHEINRAGQVAWWRTLLGSVLLILLFLWLPAVLAVPFAVVMLVTGSNGDDITNFFGLDPVTPANLAYLNLGLAAAIPSAILVAWLMHGWQRPRWLLSVMGRIRWRWFLVCLGLSVVTLIVTLVVSAFLPSDGGDSDLGGAANAFTSQTLGFLAVIVFLTPLQAAGEEFAFRGYLTQAWGGVLAGRSRMAGRLVGVLVPAFLFALAHGGQDVPVFFDRFAFGIVAGILVIATGGLEAGLAMHVLNNFMAFGLALAFGDMTSTLTDIHGSWWMIVSTLTQSLVYLALVLVVGRRFGVGVRTPVMSGNGQPI